MNNLQKYYETLTEAKNQLSTYLGVYRQLPLEYRDTIQFNYKPIIAEYWNDEEYNNTEELLSLMTPEAFKDTPDIDVYRQEFLEYKSLIGNLQKVVNQYNTSIDEILEKYERFNNEEL